jgi:hypothetical protein
MGEQQPVRVESRLEHAAPIVGGIHFARVEATEVLPPAMVSELISAEEAGRLCAIPGFVPCERALDVLAGVDAAIADQKLALQETAHRGDSTEAPIRLQLEEMQRANQAIGAENAVLKQRVEELERAGRQSRIPGLETRIADLEAQVDALTKAKVDLEGQVDALTRPPATEGGSRGKGKAPQAA